MFNLYIAWVNSYGVALDICNNQCLAGAELLDCSIIGEWTQVILRNDSPINIENQLTQVSNSLKCKQVYLKNINSKVLEAYLSLSSERVSDFLLTLEASFVGDLFEVGQKLVAEGFDIVDFRLLRYQQPRAILQISGKSDVQDKALLITQNILSNKQMNVEVNIISEISDSIKKLYQSDL